ncbi:MAG: hypothetical protein IT376_04295 [Polyangiaceae bacterium]|nr:hypothetical protein [Polyangiaceae bacterium]
MTIGATGSRSAGVAVAPCAAPGRKNVTNCGVFGALVRPPPRPDPAARCRGSPPASAEAAPDASGAAAGSPGERGTRRAAGRRGDDHEPERELPERIEPFELALAPLTTDRAPPALRAAPVATAAPAPPVVDLGAVVPRLVRRLAWGGDGRRGAARIEVGAGALGGSTITVQADGEEVALDLDLAPGIDAAPVEARLRERLARRGVRLGSVTVR